MQFAINRPVGAGLVALACATLSGGAQAQAYVLADAGWSQLDVDCGGADHCDKSGFGHKVLGGYTFGSGLSAELGFISFGRADARIPTDHAVVKTFGYTLAGAWTTPLASDWDLTLRLGLASLKTKMTDWVLGSQHDTVTKPYFGAQVGYRINPQVKLVGGVDFSQAELHGDKADARNVALGAQFDF